MTKSNFWLFNCFLMLTLGLVTSTADGQDALVVGSKAPDFELQGIGDQKVKLSDNFGADGQTTVLAFSRANW